MSELIKRLAVVNYPGALQSSVHGLTEMLGMANGVCDIQGVDVRFVVEQVPMEELVDGSQSEHGDKGYMAIVIPPTLDQQFYDKPDQRLVDWLSFQHSSGAIICSACAGAFVLAATGLLQGRKATTHWALASKFSDRYPDVKVDIEKILINDGDIITAGGLMSWLDLGLEIVAQFAHPNVMRQLGKQLVIDTGAREQRYYQSFVPRLDHGDREILKAQHYLQANYDRGLTMVSLSQHCYLTERTFLRRFFRATGFKPVQYLQRLRVQQACDLLETSNRTIESVSLMVGYEDSGAFRKVFAKVIGLTPREFRARFAG